MISMLRPKLTYANVVASLALFAALGGSSYAAISVSGKNIRNNTVTSADIRNNSVSSRDVRNGSLAAKDFRAGQLPGGAQGARGSQGAPGTAGPTGPAGVLASADAGAAGPGPTTTMQPVSEPRTVVVPAGARVHVIATKAFGSTVAGGGLGLHVAICHRPVGTSSFVAYQGDVPGIPGLRVTSGTRLPVTLARDVAGLAAGSHEFALCAQTNDPDSWNNNGGSSTTVLVHR